MVRHRDLDGRLDEVEMRVSEMRIRKKPKKKSLMSFGEKLELCGSDGVSSRVAKELLYFGEDRRRNLHGCLIGEV